MALLVVGSVAYDTIRLPNGSIYREVLGGSCTYFGLAASVLTEVRVVAVVGGDFRPAHLELLRQRSIDLTGLVIQKEGRTFRWAGTYSSDMNERTTDDLQFGVLATFHPILPPSYRQTPFVFLACAQPRLQHKVLDQMEIPPFAVFDTIEHYIRNDRDELERLFERCRGIVINEGEAKMLLGLSNLVRCSERFLERGLLFAVLKKGEHGGILATREGIYPFPAYPLSDVADPTGAGDAFAGGMMGYLAKTNDISTSSLRRAMVYGTVLASFACQGVSTQGLEHVTLEKVEDRVRRYLDLLRIPGFSS